MWFLANRILRGTDAVSQFASFPRPCPTTSRRSVIPAGNIRQPQSDFSRHKSVSNSLLGCGYGISEEPSDAERQLICIIGMDLDADLRAK
jgi:hypothetical protein